MNYDDILALVRAGYSKDEIAAMGAAAPATPAPKPEQTADPPKTKTAAVQSPDAVPAAQPPVNATEQLLQQLLGGMSTLTAAVQAQNRASITGAIPPKSNVDLAREATARLAGITYDKE